MTARLAATPAAREAIRRPRAGRGQSLMFVQSAGCCAGSTPMCFTAGEFITGEGDLLLGEAEGCSFSIDSRLYRAWNSPELVLDLAAGNRRASRSARAAVCDSWFTSVPRRPCRGRRLWS